MITKRLSPKGRSMRVTFELPGEAAAEQVAVVGDFNDWDHTRHTMKLDPKSGTWTAAISFKPGSVVQFRYLADGHSWRNDEDADEQVRNEHGTENSLLRL